MKRSKMTLLALASVLLFSCTTQQKTASQSTPQEQSAQNKGNSIDRFADIEVLKYQVPSWPDLTLKEKEYVYYLSQAGYAGRDISYDQNYKHNLKIRRALENIYQNYNGNKDTEDWRNFETYLKRVWFSNGIHHHYSNEKMKPTFSKTYLEQLLKGSNTKLDIKVADIIFNTIDTKKVNLDLSKG